MATIENITKEDLVKYKDIFSKADFVGMTPEEAVKVVDGEEEKILFVCGPVWMIFEYDENKVLKYQTFMVNEEDKVVSFTKEDYQVNVFDNMIYLIYEDGRHESLQLLKNYDNPSFEVSSNGAVIHMQYDSKRDIRCVSKYEHVAYGDCSRIYDIRLDSPYDVTIESKASKRDKGLKFLGRKDSYYRLDFDVRNNKWQYDLATIQEFGVGAVIASDTVTLHNGLREFSKYYKVLFSLGDYITVTGFPFLSQYTQDEVLDYVESYGFTAGVSEKVVELYNNKNMYLEILQQLVVLYKRRVNLFYVSPDLMVHSK